MIVVIVGLGLMFGAVLFTVLFYGAGGETNAAAILGIFLPAVTGVVGFVFGIKTGTDAGAKASKDMAASSKKDNADAANSTLALINSLEPALDNILKAHPPPATTKFQSLAATPGGQVPHVELQQYRDEYNKTIAQIQGRLKQAARIA